MYNELIKYGKGKIVDIIDFIYAVGYFGDLLTSLITIFILSGNIAYLLAYLILFPLDVAVNKLLKILIKQLRPPNPIKFLDKDRFVKSKRPFGMPSGHSENVFFSLTFIYFFFHRVNAWIILLGIIGIITMYQRYMFHNHTITQLIMGAITGCVFGYLAYKVSTVIINRM
jgi:membrane-associated phospholipid phosphatase